MRLPGLRRGALAGSRESHVGAADANGASRGVHAFLYDAEDTDGNVRLGEVAVEDLTERQLLWVDVSDNQGVDDAAATFGLGPETLQRAREPSTEPALFVHDGYVHVVVVAPEHGDLPDEPLMLHCVVGHNWVLTVHFQPIELLDRFDERIRGDSELGNIDGHGFLAAILHEHVAGYLAAIRPIERELDRLDVRSMTGRVQEESLLRELVAARVRLGRLRRLLEPHRELYALLARSEFEVLSGSQSTSDFERMTDLLERTLQSMDSAREMIVGSFDIYTTWTAHATNNVMKRLTVASVTLLPPTLLAGVMGMNSLPASFEKATTFWVTTILMACLAVTVLTVARLRDWI